MLSRKTTDSHWSTPVFPRVRGTPLVSPGMADVYLRYFRGCAGRPAPAGGRQTGPRGSAKQNTRRTRRRQTVPHGTHPASPAGKPHRIAGGHCESGAHTGSHGVSRQAWRCTAGGRRMADLRRGRGRGYRGAAVSVSSLGHMAQGHGLAERKGTVSPAAIASGGRARGCAGRAQTLDLYTVQIVAG